MISLTQLVNNEEKPAENSEVVAMLVSKAVPLDLAQCRLQFENGANRLNIPLTMAFFSDEKVKEYFPQVPIEQFAKVRTEVFSILGINKDELPGKYISFDPQNGGHTWVS